MTSWPVIAAIRERFLVTRDRVREDSAHRRSTELVVGAEEPDAVGQREHPWSGGDVGQHVIHEVGCCLGHPAGTARGTKPALLAAERDQLVLLAGRTMDATETEAEQSTFEDCAAP